MINVLDKLLSSKNNQRNIKSKIRFKGKKILKLSIKEIDKSTEYNSGLINWYQPEHYIGQHADDESNCVKNSNIASVSWGCTRRFRLTSKTHHSITLDLKDGDLVIMGGTCQKTHKHEIMKLRKKDIHKNRINFTFRSFKT